MNMKRYLKKEQLIEILKIHGLTNNIEDYQKMYSHIWRKHKPRI